jgi:hypothetical protein
LETVVMNVGRRINKPAILSFFPDGSKNADLERFRSVCMANGVGASSFVPISSMKML